MLLYPKFVLVARKCSFMPITKFSFEKTQPWIYFEKFETFPPFSILNEFKQCLAWWVNKQTKYLPSDSYYYFELLLKGVWRIRLCVEGHSSNFRRSFISKEFFTRDETYMFLSIDLLLFLLYSNEDSMEKNITMVVDNSKYQSSHGNEWMEHSDQPDKECFYLDWTKTKEPVAAGKLRSSSRNEYNSSD